MVVVIFSMLLQFCWHYGCSHFLLCCFSFVGHHKKKIIRHFSCQKKKGRSPVWFDPLSDFLTARYSLCAFAIFSVLLRYSGRAASRLYKTTSSTLISMNPKLRECDN